jgi:PKD repeat protein
MRILRSTSSWRAVTALILILASGVFLSEALARGRTRTSKSVSSTQVSSINPTGPNAPTATPGSGTLSPANPTITYTDTLVTNTTGSVLGEPVCVAPNTCSDFTLTVNAQSVAATKEVLIEGAWFPPQNDFDIFITNAGGTVIASNLQTANPSTIILPVPADGTVYHIIIEASVGAGTLEGLVKLIDIPAPINQGPGAPPRYMIYPAGPGQAPDSGEPSIGVDWNPNVASLKHDLVNTGGLAMFTSNFNQYQAHFDDCCSPALDPWVDVTDPNEQITSLDPIGFTDHYTTAQLGVSYPPPLTPGRTFFAQLAAGDSITSFTDDDGATHTPSQGGGAPAGPDHETLGGGPFHAPVPTPPAPAYPNAIYYASQSLAEAEISRSDDGGVTFGPGIPLFNPTQCLGGIHGHIKVSPQGTVYVPNSSCGTTDPVGTNGVAVSKDNGLTWNSYTVPDSTGGQDPAVAVGQNNVGKPAGQVPNTIYFGWIGADGHAHAAHSGDEGATWQDDLDVGSILGVKNAVFPVMVAGDDNRAAYSFLGTTTLGTPGDPNFQGIWHLYIAHTYDGGQTWILIDATPFDPVQKGQICLLGLGCSGGRNLLDFNGIDVDAQGRVLVGYADGCVGCNNTFTGQSQDAKGTIARQSGGRRLFSAFDQVEPAPPAAPQLVSAVRASGQVTVSWLEPDNGGSPITGYRVYRSTTSGAETFLTSVPATATKYFDNAAPATSNWFYRVTAVNAVAEGPFCREVNVNGTAAAATACLPPFITEGGAGVFGSPPNGLPADPTNGQLTLQRTAIGEPFTTCDDKSVTFVIKVNNLNPTPAPNGVWRIYFRARDTANTLRELFVQMDTTFTPTPSFNLGYRDPVGTGTSTTQCFISPTLGPCAVTGNSNPDGTITMKLDVSQPLQFFSSTNTSGVPDFTVNIPVGTNFTVISGETASFLGAGGTGSRRMVQTNGGTGTYTTIGNVAGCNTTPPLAVLSATPLTGAPPLTVNFNGSASFEPFGACGTINSYTMNFGDGSPAVTRTTAQFGANAPLFSHTYSSAGVYPARLTVTNTLGLQSVNLAQVGVTVESGQIPISGVVSRKVHGGVGPFDLVLPVSGSPAIECRSGGANNDYQLIFVFPDTLQSVADVTVSGTGTVASKMIGTDAHQYIVNLSGVTSGQYITVTLDNAQDMVGNLGDVSVTMGVLVGDTTGNSLVNSSDIAQTQSQSGKPVTQDNFREDVTANGSINSSDIALVQSKSGTALPPPPP